MKEKNTKAVKKCLSLLLAVAMLLTISEIPVLAEETKGQGADTQTTVPTNPVHNCVKEDTTDWSHVCFGSYPQSEVTGSELTDAIIGADYDENGDAEVDGIKYRRISKDDTNHDGYFGDSEYRYFKWERIKWKVLQNDGSTLFVVADTGLDCKNYNETSVSVTWENCTLRNWLNSDFYHMAFSSEEQEAIVKQNVINENNPEYGTEGGNYTTDNIFLLSIEEVTNPKYGFCEIYDVYSDVYSASRMVQASDYAHARGAYTGNNFSYAGNQWLLRSPGINERYAAYVNSNGYVNRSGSDVRSVLNTCVPAMHIDLSSELWSLADDESSGDRENGRTGDIKNPVHYCVKDHTDWNYVYFGSYPQTEVTGTALTNRITGAVYDKNGDAWVDGIKYRRISRRDTNYDEYFGNSEYRYFKWERIKWKVLQNNGSTLFVVADTGLDCEDYNEIFTSVTWETRSLRNWLNYDFYYMAFSSKEQGAIVKQNVTNEDNPEYGTEGGCDTTDNIFLLSVAEVTNPNYGFCEGYDAYSISRRVQASDYAHARGAYIGTDGYVGNCWWSLRSPGINTSDVALVDEDGYVDNDGNKGPTYYACVPAMHIKLSSDCWFLTDDGSSGEQPTTPGTNQPTTSNTNINEKTSLAKATITLSTNTYNYDGKEKKPTVTSAKLNGKTLKSGTDYSVSYKNNKNIGTATVTITGKGNYNGTATKTFTITAKKNSTFTIGAYKYKITGSSTVAFNGLKSSSTKKVTIPKTVTIGGKNFKVTSIAANALKNKKVTQVIVGNNVKTIGKNAFYKCTKLSKVTLGTAVTSIGETAFSGCTKLTGITVSSKVTTIGKGAFTNCKKLGTITIKSSKLKKVGKNAFKGIKATAKIKVPAKKLSAYKKLLKGKGQGKKVKITK